MTLIQTIIETCPFCGGNAAIQCWHHRYTPKGMDLDKLFKNFCTYIDNMTEEEFAESLRRAEEETKDCWDMY